MNVIFQFLCISVLFVLTSCTKQVRTIEEWNRNDDGLVFQDLIPSQNYQAASDPHVFYHEDELKMIYTGDHEGIISIKLANGESTDKWERNTTLLSEIGPSGLDRNKETAFYRKTDQGKHQIYYIAYAEEETYQSQIFVAEADALEGPYLQMDHPVIEIGSIAGEDVACITSPSIVEHNGLLHIVFIGWDQVLENVTEVWIIGATSSDEGKTWSDFQKVDTPIGMEGQITKRGESDFVAVRTGEFQDRSAIFYSTASHPFGPWETSEDPILVQSDDPLEKDEVIAPQITINPEDNSELLYYTGADYQVGWWIMLATED